jgi:AmmeMemoRadiSam system protein A
MHSPDRQELPGDELLRLARGSMEYGLAHGKPLPVVYGDLPQVLIDPAATFTTLRLGGELRGCCGTLEPLLPLATDVTRSAFRAAYEDPRFAPVREAELGVITVEVSVLSPLEPVVAASEEDLLQQLRPGTDGLVIVDSGRRATFLPKVWDMLPDPDRFLAQLKRKCGLPEDYWSESFEFLRYQATTFVEAPSCRDLSHCGNQ